MVRGNLHAMVRQVNALGEEIAKIDRQYGLQSDGNELTATGAEYQIDWASVDLQLNRLVSRRSPVCSFGWAVVRGHPLGHYRYCRQSRKYDFVRLIVVRRRPRDPHEPVGARLVFELEHRQFIGATFYYTRETKVAKHL